MIPGTIGPDTDRIARIAAKIVGSVSELKKQLGDTVSKGEVVAVLESREVAEAKNEYISAQVNLDLQRTLFEREQALSEKKITAENQFLRARMTFAKAQLRFDLARQKLSALNVSETGLSRQATGLQRYEIRTSHRRPSGRAPDRPRSPGGGEGQPKELYVIADLSIRRPDRSETCRGDRGRRGRSVLCPWR